MASGLEECPTGILIDYIGSTTLLISPCDKENGLEENLNVKNAVFVKSHGELSSHCQSSNEHSILSSQYLGADLNRKKDEICISSYEWRSPSPTTMSMITLEAGRIVDQLHTTMETSLWDEEFPLSSASEDECFEEISNESEKLSQDLIVTECFSSTEEKLCVNSENNGVENVIEENSVTIEEHSGVTEKYFSVKCSSENNSNVNSTKESSKATDKKYVVVENNVVIEESCVIKEICAISKESPPIMEKVIEENNTVVEKSSLVPEDFKVTENSVAVKESIETENPVTESDHAVSEEKFVTESNFMLNEERCTITEESCTITEESCTIFDESCTIVYESFNMIEENSTANEKSKETEEIGIVMEDNLSADILNIGEDMHDLIVSPEESRYAHTDNEQMHVFSKTTLKVKNDKPKETIPLSMKSKLVKIFKTPTFKTPIKYKKLEEKENVLQECKDKNVLFARKITKTGQASSMKAVLGANNMKSADILTGNLKTPSSKNIIEKNPLVKEIKATNVPQDHVKETLEKSNTPLKRMNSLKFQPVLSKKTPVFKSYSVAETPNTAKVIRRSSSFQTRQVENPNQIKKEKSFLGDNRPKNVNSRRSLIQIPRIGNELQTPSKIGSFLPKFATPVAIPISSNTKSCTRISQVVRPSFGSALRQTNAPVEESPQVVGFKRPASTTSKARITSRLDMPSPLPKMTTDSIPRRLFPDYSTPLKRRI